MTKTLLEALRHYADFRGRTTRREFWVFVTLTQGIVLLLLLPAWFLLLELLRTVLESPRVLDILVAAIQYPQDAYDLLRDDLPAALLPYGEEFWHETLPASPTTLICTSLALLLTLFLILPTLSITVRRLRDSGHSAWWVLPPCLTLIPLPILADFALLGTIVTLAFCCQKSAAPSLPLDTPAPPAA